MTQIRGTKCQGSAIFLFMTACLASLSETLKKEKHRSVPPLTTIRYDMGRRESMGFYKALGVVCLINKAYF
jgi:hypothetical protein